MLTGGGDLTALGIVTVLLKPDNSRGRARVTLGHLAAIATVSGTVATGGAIPSAAKTPGTTYCFNEICHRVLTLQTTAALIGREIEHETSYYDGCKQDVFNPCGLTSSGEVFRPGRPDNAASPVYPDGTTLLVFNPETQQAAVVRVNNAGPYWGRRKLDVSRATADKLGFRKKGVAKLRVMVIGVPTETEARYRQRRSYEAVPGPIGQYASMTDARRSVTGLLTAAASRYAGLRTGTITTGAIQQPSAEVPVSPATDPVTLAALSDAAETSLRRQPQWAAIEPAAVHLISLPPVTYAGTARLPLLGLGGSAPATIDTAATAPAGTERPSVAEVANSAAGSAVASSDEGTDFPTATAAPAHAGPALRYALGTPSGAKPTIEIAVTRRVDLMTGDNQMQPVLGSLPLDDSTDLMERDLDTGRVTQFAPKFILTSLPAAPAGRLGMFARSAGHDMSVSRSPNHAADQLAANRVSTAVRWARMRITGATDVPTNEVGR